MIQNNNYFYLALEYLHKYLNKGIPNILGNDFVGKSLKQILGHLEFLMTILLE